MKYEEHTAIGIVGLLVLSKIDALGLDANIISGATTAVASILADLDHLESRISNRMYSGASRVITNLLRVIPIVLSIISYIQFNKWNHTYNFTDNYFAPFIVGAVVFVIFSISIREQYQVIKKIVAYGISAGLIAYGVYKGNRILFSIGVFIGTYTVAGHRSGVTHSITSSVVATLIFYKIDLRYGMDLSKYVMLGYFLHVFADCFTTRGCPILFPFTNKRFRFGYKILKFDREFNIKEYILFGFNIVSLIILYIV